MLIRMDGQAASGGGTEHIAFYHTEYQKASSYIDVTVKKATDIWYLIFDMPPTSHYDTWQHVYINGVSIGNMSVYENDMIKLGVGSGTSNCWILPMETHLNVGDVVRLEEVNNYVGIGMFIIED